jgi:hypothetical protein
MSTIMMVMVAGMVAATDGMERVSTETEQRLGIEGEWEGTWYGRIPSRHGWHNQPMCSVRIKPGFISLQGDNWTCSFGPGVKWFDEGNGKFRVANWQGIYKREGGRLSICFIERYAGLLEIFQTPRPTIFQAGEGRTLLILKPAKPKK